MKLKADHVGSISDRAFVLAPWQRTVSVIFIALLGSGQCTRIAHSHRLR
ncbi:hypothetical protein C4K03_4116 [Pseudomonas synxantha]|uniref:Uncharacterized protein n=1 Tax=Pseudomonas synxantha TaxID=47883 RepID=A0A3G7UA40_9PSED|nr:hypothetical protein C4K03_4116 [Pseudomonas synxantha]